MLRDYSTPKNGKAFEVVGFGRVSTDNQNEKSLGDQHEYDLDYLKQLMPKAQFKITTISGRGSGQYLDRKEFIELSELVATGRYDIVVAEDLGRILRRVQAFIFCEEAEDVGTRVIAINEMSASWAKDGFVSMTSMRLARRKPHNYSADFEKALIHSYSDYVFGKEQAGHVGPNHFACLSILQWGIGEKENAVTTADKMIDAAKAFSNGREYYVKSYERFAKSVHESTMPEFSELSKWMREAKQEATSAN